MRGNQLAAVKDDDEAIGVPISSPQEAIARLEGHVARLLSGKLTKSNLLALQVAQRCLREARENTSDSPRAGGSMARILPNAVVSVIDAHIQASLALGFEMADVPTLDDTAFVEGYLTHLKDKDRARLSGALSAEPLRIEVTHACHRCGQADPEYPRITPEPARPKVEDLAGPAFPALVKGHESNPAVVDAPKPTAESPDAALKEHGYPYQVIGGSKQEIRPGQKAIPGAPIFNDHGVFHISYVNEFGF